MVPSWRYRPLRTRTCQPTNGLTSGCPLSEVKDHPASLGVTCASMSSPSVNVDLLNREYCYKSVVATQIPHDARRVAICQIIIMFEGEFLDIC